MVNSIAATGAISDTQLVRAITTPTSQAAATGSSESVATATEKQPILPPAKAEAEPPIAQVRQAAKELETFMQSMNRYLEFRIDQDSGRTVVTVKDRTTGDTVRQIPTEEVLRLAQNLGGKRGNLVSQAV